MIVDKTYLGVPFFDEVYGGVYRGRQVLVSGRYGSCKSILAYQFLGQAIQNGEKALLLSNVSAHDSVIVAESMGLPFSAAVESEQLVILEYASFISDSPSSGTNVMLPPEAFLELQDKVESLSVRRLVFDSVLPWVEIQPVERIAEHVYSFIHALDRLNCTTLLTIPKPVSTSAFNLKSRLDDHCPVGITLDHKDNKDRTFRVTKYLGEVRPAVSQFNFDVLPGRGIVLAGAHSAPPPVPTVAPAAQPAVAARTAAAPVVPPPVPPYPQPHYQPPTAPMDGPRSSGSPAGNSHPISFSSVIKFPH